MFVASVSCLLEEIKEHSSRLRTAREGDKWPKHLPGLHSAPNTESLSFCSECEAGSRHSKSPPCSFWGSEKCEMGRNRAGFAQQSGEIWYILLHTGLWGIHIRKTLLGSAYGPYRILGCGGCQRVCMEKRMDQPWPLPRHMGCGALWRAVPGFHLCWNLAAFEWKAQNNPGVSGLWRGTCGFFWCSWRGPKLHFPSSLLQWRKNPPFLLGLGIPAHAVPLRYGLYLNVDHEMKSREVSDISISMTAEVRVSKQGRRKWSKWYCLVCVALSSICGFEELEMSGGSGN